MWPINCAKTGKCVDKEILKNNSDTSKLELSKKLIIYCALYCHSFAKITRGELNTNHRISKKICIFVPAEKIKRQSSRIHGPKSVKIAQPTQV